MKKSACTLDCMGTCSFMVEEKEGTALIRGNPDHPFSEGLICSKGKGLLKRINHPERITEPLLKKNGIFEPVSWKTAFDICEQKIKELSAEEILHIKGFGYRGVLAKASKELFRTLGTLETYGSLCDGAGCEAVLRNFGTLDQNEISDLNNAEIIINWGRDLSRSSIHINRLIKKVRNKGTKVVSISPGGDGNEKLSDETILIRPGTDRFLAAAITKMLINDHKADPEPIKNSRGFESFSELLNKYELEHLSEICGVGTDKINKLYQIYKSNKKISSLIGWGVQRYQFGGENVRYITALCALSGKIGKKGCGFYYNISSGRNFASWTKAPETPPEKKILLQKLENDLKRRDRKVRFIWIDGINVANQIPDCTSAARVLENCDFVVTVDAFMNDTAIRSDLILPCALTMEREDILGSAGHNIICCSGKAFEPRGQARSDFEIIWELGKRLFANNPIPPAEECLEIAMRSPSISVTLDELRERGFARTEWPDIAYENFTFGHPDGKMHLPQKLNHESEADGFNLLTLVRKNYLHSQIPPEKQSGLPDLSISPSSPLLKGISENSEVSLCTSTGKIKVRIKYDSTIHPETAILRRGGWMKYGRSANTIIEPLLTDMGFGAAYYSQKAWLEPS